MAEQEFSNTPLRVDDITNLKEISREYYPTSRAYEYKFTCEICGEPDILTYEHSYHDNDEERFLVYAEKNDLRNHMSSKERQKLETVVSQEVTLNMWLQEIEKANSPQELREVQYGLWESEHLNLLDEQIDIIYKKMDEREKSFSTPEDDGLMDSAYEKDKSGTIGRDTYYDGQRLFVDMDGVLAKFQTVDHLEQLLEKGYFLNLPSQQNVVDAVKILITENPEKEVFILSSVLTDSHYAFDEKNAWLDKYLPEIDKDHRIFPPCGESKTDYIPDGLRVTDCLLDDYTNNLVLWEPPAKGIKLLNGINHTKGTWKGSMISKEDAPSTLKNKLLYVMEGGSLRPTQSQSTSRPIAKLKGPRL